MGSFRPPIPGVCGCEGGFEPKPEAVEVEGTEVKEVKGTGMEMLEW